MTNQQGAPDALTDFEHRHAIRQGYEIAASDRYFEARQQIDSNDRRKAFQAGFERGWDRLAALVEAQQPATHVQNPAGIEHVAGDVSKNGAESNMSTQQTAPAGFVPVAAFDRLYAHAESLAAQLLATPQRDVQEPCGWIYDWTHSSAAGKPDTTYTGFTKDEAHARKHDNCIAVFTTQQPAPATQQAGEVVAYLDVGANGYLDLGAALSEDALQQLPKGRHALVIAGTYGIDGYVAAPQPSPEAQPAPAAGITVEQVEDAIGLQSTAWDTIGAEKIVEAVLRLANAKAPAAGAVAGPDGLDGAFYQYKIDAASTPSAQAAESVPAMSDAARDLLAERARHVQEEGWTPEHDDEHSCGEMAEAAACYAASARVPTSTKRRQCPGYWPWAAKWWKPSDQRRDLIKAGALILAELERIDRATRKQGGAA